MKSQAEEIGLLFQTYVDELITWMRDNDVWVIPGDIDVGRTSDKETGGPYLIIDSLDIRKYDVLAKIVFLEHRYGINEACVKIEKAMQLFLASESVHGEPIDNKSKGWKSYHQIKIIPRNNINYIESIENNNEDH